MGLHNLPSFRYPVEDVGANTHFHSAGLVFKGSPQSCALFSRCEKYRYYLWRELETLPSGAKHKVCSFVGLNPSTADELVDDPTVRRCMRFAKSWGYTGMYMLNAFAYRATDPLEMKKQSDPLGPANREYLKQICMVSDLVVVAWGNHCSAEDQAETLRALDVGVHCFDITKTGRPKHPLYCKADIELKQFWAPWHRLPQAR